MSTPTSKTLALLRSQGYYPWVVERFIPPMSKRDLFHIIDIVCCIPTGILGVQSCGTAFAPHVQKLMEDEAWHTRHWLNSGGRELVLIGWRKLKQKRGGKRMIFKPRIAFITMKQGVLSCQEVKYIWLRQRKKAS